ncbi:hypothetical protein O181_091685 [Austropuccinia psidii MF-1]|uniref:Uncharacterized protein n=1 Tax=Austropuccinia psidii MF-1 TaxID=1389203 RepID=A0A9Q3IX69_9BASI|nr:hypothetical protein [Austropuccinia psidii MF-1]
MPPMPPSHWPDPYAPAFISTPYKNAAPHLFPHHPLHFRTPTLSSLPLTILTLPRSAQDMPPTPPSIPLMPNPLSATYHPYAQVLDPYGTVACWCT